ncbi:MAG TPA: nitroreductase family protein, partial [Nannocystaceae bacterium]|nr:nitroreductase family protein [Nannocystaceae bacterium]
MDEARQEALDEVRALRLILARRRAIRDFAPTPVPLAALRSIVADAALAPSSMGLQPYVMHVVVAPRPYACRWCELKPLCR